MTPQPPNQEDLLAYVNNPDNIAKAAEGSMEKRQAVMDSQPSKTDTQMTQEKTEALLKAIQLEWADRLDDVYLTDYQVEQLTPLIDAYAQQREQAADDAAIAIIKPFTEMFKDPCSFDHNHSCQEHGWFFIDQGELCPAEAAKRYLEKATPTLQKGDIAG